VFYISIGDFLTVSKFLKNIPVFFLWVAGLTLSAHQIIPHDHHITDSFSNQEKNCPASNSESGHKSGFPLHCHAFNDLASEKAKPVQVLQNIQFSFVTFSILTDSSAFNLQGSRISLIDFSKSIFNSFALDLSLLRAPPVSA